jgi:uncharacterized protein
MRLAVDHVAGQTFHGRRGAVENAFRYSVDYVCLDAEAAGRGPPGFGRNRGGLASLHDRDHGGAPGQGRGAAWAREVLAAHGLAGVTAGRLEILAQPRVLGHVFNPVAFWLAHDAGGRLRVVIAEVTNTYGDRHSYLCHRDDLEPIEKTDTLTATKIFHVSPFQPVEGGYTFRFDIRADRIGVWIDYTSGNGGLIATLTGRRRPLTTRAMLASALRRPLGSRRVLGLIHWQALKLWWKGARFNARPEPPAEEVTR